MMKFIGRGACTTEIYFTSIRPQSPVLVVIWISSLKNKNGLVILPEGNHGDKRKLRTLKKGISRIAFEAVTFFCKVSTTLA